MKFEFRYLKMITSMLPAGTCDILVYIIYIYIDIDIDSKVCVCLLHLSPVCAGVCMGKGAGNRTPLFKAFDFACCLLGSRATPLEML